MYDSLLRSFLPSRCRCAATILPLTFFYELWISGGRKIQILKENTRSSQWLWVKVLLMDQWIVGGDADPKSTIQAEYYYLNITVDVLECCGTSIGLWKNTFYVWNNFFRDAAS